MCGCVYHASVPALGSASISSIFFEIVVCGFEDARIPRRCTEIHLKPIWTTQNSALDGRTKVEFDLTFFITLCVYLNPTLFPFRVGITEKCDDHAADMAQPGVGERRRKALV